MTRALSIMEVVSDCQDQILREAWSAGNLSCICKRLRERLGFDVSLRKESDCLSIEVEPDVAFQVQTVLEEFFVLKQKRCDSQSFALKSLAATCADETVREAFAQSDVMGLTKAAVMTTQCSRRNKKAPPSHQIHLFPRVACIVHSMSSFQHRPIERRRTRG